MQSATGFNMRAVAQNLEAKRTKVTEVIYVFSPFVPMICAPVPEGLIPAGVIFPCEAIAQPHNINDTLNVPEADRLHTYPAAEGKAAVVLLNLPAADYIEPVLRQYQAHGAIRIRALDRFPIDKFEQQKLSAFVVGENPPTTAREWAERLQKVEAENNSPQFRVLFDEMRAAVKRAYDWGVAHIDKRHSEMDLAKVGKSQEPAWYTPQDKRALLFTGITPRNEVQDKLASGLLDAMRAPAAPPPPVNVQVVIDGAALSGVVKAAVDEALGGSPAAPAEPSPVVEPAADDPPRKRKGN